MLKQVRITITTFQNTVFLLADRAHPPTRGQTTLTCICLLKRCKMLTSESVHTNTVLWKCLISPEITCVGGQLLSVSELVKKKSVVNANVSVSQQLHAQPWFKKSWDIALNVNKKDAQICFIKCFEPVFNWKRYKDTIMFKLLKLIVFCKINSL